MMDLKQRLAKVRSSFIVDHPFFGSLSMRLPFEITTDVPTAATDGTKVMFNPDWCSKLTDPELMFLVAHEIFHPLLEHNWRRQGRDPTRYNIAADIIINYTLVQDKIGSMPKSGVYDADLYHKGKTTEGVYNLLPENQKGDASKYQLMDDCRDASGSPAEQAQAAAEMRVMVAQAAQMARAVGKFSKPLERLVGEALAPKVDWRSVLAEFIEACQTGSRTWARPKRNYLAQGVYLPSEVGEHVPAIVVAVDCSGSVNDELLGQFTREIQTIHGTLQPEQLHVLYFDHSVLRVDTFEPNDTVTTKRYGGGGTAFSPIWKRIEHDNLDVAACVVLTDLQCHDFGNAPDYPVLWVTTDAEKAPFGRVVRAV